jgi:hypothetical protein
MRKTQIVLTGLLVGLGVYTSMQQDDSAAEDIMRLVEVPASYKTVIRMLQIAAHTQTVEIPAEYKVVYPSLTKFTSCLLSAIGSSRLDSGHRPRASYSSNNSWVFL